MHQEMVWITHEILVQFIWFFLGFLLIVFFFDDLGDVVVILDLRPDESLFEAGIAREVNCRIFDYINIWSIETPILSFSVSFLLLYFIVNLFLSLMTRI